MSRPVSAPTRRPAARLGSAPLFVREVRAVTSSDPLTVAVSLRVAGCVSDLPLIRVVGTNATGEAPFYRECY